MRLPSLMSPDERIAYAADALLTQWVRMGNTDMPPLSDMMLQVLFQHLTEVEGSIFKKESALLTKVVEEIHRMRKVADEIDKLDDPYDRLKEYRKRFEVIFGKQIKDSDHKLSCKKGCSHCCYITVSSSDEEMDVILDQVGYPLVDLQKLELQARESVDPDRYTTTIDIKHRDCPFLKNGSCSIYNERPMACRRHNAVTDPNLCDTTKGLRMVGSAYFLVAEIFYAIFVQRYGDKNMYQILLDRVRQNMT